MKKIFNILIWFIVIAGLFIVLGFVEIRHNSMTCCDINVTIDYDDAEPLITAEELKVKIIKAVDSIKGKPLNQINFQKIKDEVFQNPYVAAANVFTDIDGEFNIKVTQRKPVVRIINKNNHSYYIDEEGIIMPAQPGHSARVIVANGHINDTQISFTKGSIDLDTLKGHPLHHDILKLVRAIRNDDFLHAQIDQIYVNEAHEFELIPKMGRQLILFGTIHHMDDKLRNLKAFYEQGLSRSGWMEYRKINLKFKNQIVCTKR